MMNDAQEPSDSTRERSNAQTGQGSSPMEYDIGPLSIAVIIPCHNEELAIKQCVEEFEAALPASKIYVYDNVSSDHTAEQAKAAGAIVRSEPKKGKGNVVRRMFADIEADIYLIVDGDCSYDARSAPRIIKHLVSHNLDMVIGTRSPVGENMFRPGHKFGNAAFSAIVKLLFGSGTSDTLSGYRALSRRFVKSFPSLSHGFEIETEITVHALSLSIPFEDVRTDFFNRAEGTESKLSSVKDGLRILYMIINMLRLERPVFFFALIAGVIAFSTLAFGIPIIVEFLETGLVHRFPTLIVAAALMVLSGVVFMTGIVLDSTTHARRELRRLAFLSLPSVQATLESKRNSATSR